MKRLSSLSSRIWLVLAAAALPIFLYSLLGYFDRREHAIADVGKEIRHMLRTALVEERVVVDNAHQILQIMAKSADLRRLDASECSGLAERLLSTQTNFNNFGAVLPDGRVFCSGLPLTQAVNFSDRAWFQEALRTKQMTRGHYLLERISDRRVVVFGAPLLDRDGKLLAVLFAATTMDWLERTAEAVALPEGWSTLALDQEGRVIARFPDPERLRGKVVEDRELVRFVQTRPAISVREIEGLDGVKRYYGVTPLASSGTDVYLAIGAKTEKVMGDIDRAFYREIGLMLVVFAFSAWLAWMEFQRSFARWAQQLGAAVRRFGTGDSAAPEAVESKVRELADLSAAFTEMEARIESGDRIRRADEVALRASERRVRQELERVEVLLALHELAGKQDEKDFLGGGLEAAERLTGSRMGFLHFVNEDQETLELVTWTAGALKHCSATHDRHYPISQAGIWADCFRERRPVVFNDYAHTPNRKGVPTGHVDMTRLVSVPIIEEDKVRMMLGVGNKDEDYDDYDVETLQLIGNELWRVTYGTRVEHSLAESWERFYSIFNSISEAIFLHDAATGLVVELNDAAVAMYGYERSELVGDDVGKLSVGEPPYTLEAAMSRIVLARAGEPQLFEWHARRRDGTSFWVEVNLRFAAIGGKDHLLAVVQDITERRAYEAAADMHLQKVVALNKKLEDAHVQLLQSEKLASIGQLAAGVAHEINNPVGYVYSNIGSLAKYLQDFIAMLDAYERAESEMSDAARATVRQLRQNLDLGFLKQDVQALLVESREGINRVKKIVQDLKDFARAGSGDEWQWADLHAGLDSTLNIVWNELKYKTTVTKEYGELPLVYCLSSQINQVFMNLLVNAAHAIDTQGVVTLRTGRAGDEVWVEVEDTGAGIPPENLQRIFDPFFTTKPVGKGTGLGLSVSYSIVQKHRGRIEVRSEVGKGSAFRVWLPIQP